MLKGPCKRMWIEEEAGYPEDESETLSKLEVAPCKNAEKKACFPKQPDLKGN